MKSFLSKVFCVLIYIVLIILTISIAIVLKYKNAYICFGTYKIPMVALFAATIFMILLVSLAIMNKENNIIKCFTLICLALYTLALLFLPVQRKGSLIVGPNGKSTNINPQKMTIYDYLSEQIVKRNK